MSENFVSSIQKICPIDGKRTIFFAGKGGVGKTVISSSTAVHLAQKGYKTLLVSTDPASHLSQVFEQQIGSEVTEIKGIENLFSACIDQAKAASEYKKRILDEAKNKYSLDMLEAMKEELESPCTEEMAAFEKFLEYATQSDYDVTIFDTAPTGHTLRLLGLPLDWGRQLEIMVAAKPGSEAYLQTKVRYDRIIKDLRDEKQTIFIFIMYPEFTPIIEAYRASTDLKKTGIETGMVIVNQMLPDEYCTTPFLRKRWQTQQKYLDMIKEKFANIPFLMLPLMDTEIKGVSKLRRAASILWEQERNDVEKIVDLK